MIKRLPSIKKLLITLAKIAGVFFILAVVSYFSFRNLILHKVIEKISEKSAREFDAVFTVKEASFTGISTIELHQISLKPKQHDSLLYVNKLITGVQPLYALFLDIRLSKLELHSGYINIINNDNGSNLSGFFKGKDTTVKAQEKNGEQQSNLAKKGYQLISKVLNFIPDDVQLHNVALRFQDQKQFVVFQMQQLTLTDNQLKSSIHVMEAKDSLSNICFIQDWLINGYANPGKRKADVSFFNTDTGKVLLPYVKEKFNLSTGFDSIRLKLDGVVINDGVLNISGLASTVNFLVSHPKISGKEVVVEHAEFKYDFVIGANFIGMDSSSWFTLNKIKVQPFAKYQRGPDTTVQFCVVIPKTTAQDFISSLPEGLFNHFKGMEAEGSFTYRLDFLYNENRPKDLVFESSLQKEGLRIIKYGEANLSKLNSDFVYHPIENGRPQRAIEVSYTSPTFVPLDMISPWLKKSVLTTEDPSFFYHRGFIDEAFRQSIIKNIRKKKFARGASTISMQLIKNVFLTREKTLSRKLEEILLVYILENNRLSSKERMFEVYLNIIEWGPNVYGIGEAARFYFNKSANELTLSEALFLAVIIPSPKKFMWRFGKDGYLKDHVGRHFHSLAGLMIRRNVLSTEDTIGLNHRFPIIGPAKSFIKITADTLTNDTIIIDENGLILPVDEE